MTEQWVTSDDLRAAALRYVEQMPGVRLPLAYTVGRVTADGLSFAHINRPGGDHHLAGIVLAFVCGYRSGTATYELNAAEFARAIDLLAPAEAATHVDHPNLWSWRPLLTEAGPTGRFIACFLGDIHDDPVNCWDTQFRSALR